MKDKSSILIIYTGGTIGMKQDPMSGALVPFDFSQILEEVPQLRKFACRVDSLSFDPIIDSSDVEPGVWQRLARLIGEKYDDYDGFVVLHGTDTMAYSASALSYMLDSLTKPVVFTGSQLPIGVPRTDGKENLIAAVEIASARNAEGHPMVPEVCIYFSNRLIRGNRATKISSDDFNAFVSPNCPPLAEAGIDIKYNRQLIRTPQDWDARVKVMEKLDTRVSILKMHPGITPQIVRICLCSPEIRAAIIETYGSGNATTQPWFLSIVKEAAQMGKMLLNVTQCTSGSVNMDIYNNGRMLKECGVIGGGDITTEGALGKLFHLLGNCTDKMEIRMLLSTSLRGEIS